ncbi:penicillin acylase family protein [Peribacillus kribbensis]|uniref:penicillin acylase family protein n=1 Tax=Peribacillus kribbensis TaxID=356658 RepID=UPI0004298F42|nr:penicillin acylase family protein [Peribacillus kribbensis]
MEIEIRKRKTRYRVWKWAAWSMAALLFIAILAITGANYYASRSLPKIEGEIRLTGLKGSVSVLRDSSGVPHITAQNEHDLFTAQGYVQAQDRLFQMDLSRRQASGTLSEVIGKATVDRDKYFRTLGLRRAAEKSYAAYSEEAKNALKWYAEGVNVFIHSLKKNGKWPVEFKLAGYTPEEWTPIDSLTIGKYMAFDLGGHWQSQAFNQYLLQKFSKEKAMDLFPSYPENAPTIIAKNDLDMETAFAGAVIPHEFNGSNNWVVGGSKSGSGKPLLADDPHLSLATPSIWYQMQLKTDSINVSGVIFAGIPGIILGHNDHIAWGVTNTGPDVQDLYIEKENPAAKNEFLHNGKWEKAEVVKEPIKVKDSKTIPYQVSITRHGPIISEFAGDSGKNVRLSLRWTALDPSGELEAVLNMNKAKNWNEFEKALEKFQVPAQNFVFASNDGTIAYKANGNIPIRKKGEALLPVPGWNDDYEWKGFIPYNQLPKTVNPAAGFISTANNKVAGDEYPYHISNIWAQPYRQMRIQQVLQSKDKLTVKDMQNLQMDKLDLQAEEFTPLFLKELEKEKLTSLEREALKILRGWNYQDDKNKAAPLIFNLWMGRLNDEMFNGQISDEMLDLFDGRRAAVDNLLRNAFNGKESIWIKEQGGLSAYLNKCLADALDDIKSMQGSNPDEWKWGTYHKVRFDHPLSSISLLKYIFNRGGGLPVGGSSVTVQAASADENGIVNHGGSWRFTIDTADLNKGYHLVGPGQSGHFKSKWYHDQLDDWVNGTYHATKLNEKKGSLLELMPSKSRE